MKTEAPKKGVYISKSGKLKVFEHGLNKFGKLCWIVDAGETRQTPFRGIKVCVVHEMTPEFPIFESFGPLYKCEYLGEL